MCLCHCDASEYKYKFGSFFEMARKILTMQICIYVRLLIARMFICLCIILGTSRAQVIMIKPHNFKLSHSANLHINASLYTFKYIIISPDIGVYDNFGMRSAPEF